MSFKAVANCLYCILIAGFMLFYQPVFSQNKFIKIEHWVDENLPQLGGNAVMLIYKDGNIVFNYAASGANEMKPKGRKLRKAFNGNSTVDANKKILIASCSKWLSAALVMTFVDEGKLKLSDSIGTYLQVMTQNGKGAITLAECLSHTTGIDAGGFSRNKEFTSAENTDEVMEAIAKMPMEAAHGTLFHYSSVGLQIAAAIVEKIGGETFQQLFQQKIAQKCNMKNTDWGNKKIALPAGGARSTANDYMNFLVMILSKGNFRGVEVLSRQSVALMQQSFTAGKMVKDSPAGSLNWGYGLGEWIMAPVNKENPAVSSPGLFGSFPWMDNAKGYAALLFTFNLKRNDRIKKYMELKALVDEALQKP